MSVAAYRSASLMSEPPRAAEQRIFIEVTARLEAHRATGYITPDFAEALHANRLLWLTLADDLVEPDNAYPQALKTSLIQLAIWVARHTSLVLDHKAGIDALIDVNRSIIRGLATAPAAPVPVQETTGHVTQVEA